MEEIHVENVFGHKALNVVYPSDSRYCILWRCLSEVCPTIQNVNVLAIIFGWVDKVFDLVAARYSVHSGYDGYDNVAEGYRSIVRAMLAEGAGTETLRRNYCEVLLNNLNMLSGSGLGWLALCDVGVWFVESRSRRPMLLPWNEITNVYYSEGDDCIVMEKQEERIEVCFPSCQFGFGEVKRIADEVLRVLKIKG